MFPYSSFETMLELVDRHAIRRRPQRPHQTLFIITGHYIATAWLTISRLCHLGQFLSNGGTVCGPFFYRLFTSRPEKSVPLTQTRNLEQKSYTSVSLRVPKR